MMAFDTGPGNVMVDHIMKVRVGRPYDRGSELASGGQIIPTSLQYVESSSIFLSKTTSVYMAP